ncbi:ABC transporter ATP-binding protein [Parasulfitobacter algicola]|uniref:ABC transporter ATP-binding protein n=1 Tax=Parasulfitobacter algicola TaxID=2614809 RepID=A0ABX2IS03_9RHOB|nr:ABC transporter ATP-binding protein [Sulfitobacter algicola]NSX53557.1 ABC transporter ATP-binding protein [Sulfitobacter algicola]
MKISNLINAFQHSDGPPPQSLFAFFQWCLSGAGLVILVAAFFSVIVGALEVISALILGVIIDQALDAGPGAFFAQHWLALTIFILFFIGIRPGFIGISALMNSAVIGPNLYPMVLSRLHRWTMGQSVSFFDNDFAGRIAQKQMQTARAVTDVMVELVTVVAFALASIIGAVLLLTTIDWRISIILGLWLVGYIFLIRWFIPRVRKKSSARANARTMVSGQVIDTITNIKTVKLFAHADHEDRAALNAMDVFRNRAVDFGYLSAGFRFALTALAGLLPVFLIGSALLLWTNNLASAGDIAATGAIALRIAQMSNFVSFTLMGIYANIGEIEDGIRTLNRPYSLTDIKDADTLSINESRIEFKDVTFTYGRKEGGIADINLTIKPGEKLGIVGASGAGKSTLVALLLRLYECEKGAIFIDGHNIRDVGQESLRRQIGMVTQETAMFNRSARDNILYGQPGASEDQIIEATQKAEAHEFVLGLQDHKGRSGYDAFLGERGVKLSGGQRQRIALARAILKDAPILVLDEATSALDSEVEASIQRALVHVMTGKTVLAIAHRLSTISQMDRIIVLENGAIVEQGTHQELLEMDGVYARYWHRQSGAFLPSEEAAE